MCRRSNQAYGPPFAPMGPMGPRMMNQQQTAYIPVANCPHKRHKCCKACRRSYGYTYSRQQYPPTEQYGYAQSPAAYGQSQPPMAYGRNTQRRCHGPIGLLIGAVTAGVSAVKSHQDQKRAETTLNGEKPGPSHNAPRAGVYQEPMAARSDPVLPALDREAEESADEDAPPRYSFTGDRNVPINVKDVVH